MPKRKRNPKQLNKGYKDLHIIKKRVSKLRTQDLNELASYIGDLLNKRVNSKPESFIPVQSTQAAPTNELPTLIKEHSLIKRVRQRGTVELEDCEDKVIKPSGKRTVLEPEVKPTIKRSELDDYGDYEVKFTKHNVDLAAAAAEFAAASSASTTYESVEEVSAVEYQEFDLDSL